MTGLPLPTVAELVATATPSTERGGRYNATLDPYGYATAMVTEHPQILPTRHRADATQPGGIRPERTVMNWAVDIDHEDAEQQLAERLADAYLQINRIKRPRRPEEWTP